MKLKKQYKTILIIIVFLLRLLPYKSSFIQKFNFYKVDNLYHNSQFAKNPEDRKLIIQDWDLYSYAGLVYLKTGQLDRVNIEHPPLGKYLLGLSVLISGSPILIQIPIALLLLYLSFLISLRLLKKEWLAILIPVFLCFESLFIHQLTHSLLDLMQTAMIALFILTAINSNKDNKKTKIILGLVLGAAASIKFPVTAIILGSCYFIYLIVLKGLKNTDKVISLFMPVLIISISFYIITYLPLLLKQGFMALFDLQIKALKIHLSHLPEYPPFVPLRVMFLNQWPVWWDIKNPIHQAEEWNIFWPVLALSMLLSPFAFLKKLNKKEKKKNLLIFLFPWSYFVFLNTRLFFPGYLFLILNFLYLFLIWQLKTIIKSIKAVL